MLFLNGYALCEKCFHKHTVLTPIILSDHESFNPEQFDSKLCFLHWSNIFGSTGNTVAVAKWVLMPLERGVYLISPGK